MGQVTMIPETYMERVAQQVQRMVPETTTVQVPQQTMEPVTVQVPRMTPQETTVMVPLYHRDGGHSGPQDSRAGGANPLGSNDKLPAIPNCVTTNDHACSTASDHFLCSPNYLCSSNHLLCSSNHLWRRHRRRLRWHYRRKHHRWGSHLLSCLTHEAR